MKITQIILIFGLVIMAMCATGCAKPPTEEMNKAADAVTRAENDNNAVTYAGNSIARAKDSLARMYNEANSKRYDAALAYANEAIAAAERAINEGRTGAASAREEAGNLLSELKPLIAETEQGINAAIAAGLPIEVELVRNEFAEANQNADQAQTAFSGNRYQESINKGRAARSGLDNINKQLSVSAMAVTRKK
ncbi:MAG: DUF4398 domain-containing protein [Treponema sp.]|nr:DUF4398 domain-containing protein [Treponema sp.]